MGSDDHPVTAAPAAASPSPLAAERGAGPAGRGDGRLGDGEPEAGEEPSGGCATTIDRQAWALAVVEQAADASFVHDLEGRLVDANRGACAMLGYRRDELLRLTAWDLTTATDRAGTEALWQAVVRSAQPLVLESRLRRCDGSTLPVEIRTGSYPAGGRPLLVALLRDISEQRRSERALRDSEERYRSLVDNLDDIVFSVDLEGRLTFVSRAVERFGYRPQDLLGAPRDRFIHPDDLGWLWRAREVEPPDGHRPLEYRIVDAEGRPRFVRGTTRPLLVEGRCVGMTGVLVDLTHQRDIEDQLRVAQKMEAVGRLAGGVAHDFNNILSVILSYTELAVQELRSEDPMRADLQEVARAGRRAESLTRQLLAFSRRQVLSPEPLQLNLLVDGIGRMLQRLIGEDIELRLLPGHDLYTVLADKGQVEQVIMNLAVNSRDAMPGGGLLTVATANVEVDPARAVVLDVPPGPYVELRVSDTGCGMDAAVRARIFEPFYTTKGVGKGTGLGLAMVYGIVKQSGGGIAVESAPGKGASFRVYLPRHEPQGEAEGPAGSESPASARGRETILLVEDEPALRHVSRRMLVAAGYRVLEAESAMQALQLAEQNAGRVDLVMTDVVMPGLSGQELVARLAPLCPAARVLFTSGYSDEAIAQHGPLGPDFLAKPYDLLTLTATVRKLLDRAD